MVNRVRPIRKEICLTEQEEQIIKSKMAELGTHMTKASETSNTSWMTDTPERISKDPTSKE